MDLKNHEGREMSTILTTDAVDPRDRVAYWTDMICNVYVQLSCDPRLTPDFTGSIRRHTLPNLDMSIVSSSAQSVLRTSSLISRSSDDYFLVSIQTKGVGVVRQDGRDAVLAPGDFALYNSSRQYELLFEQDFEQIVLKLSGDSLRNAVRDTHALTASKVSGDSGAGHLLINMLKTLRDDISSLQPESALAVSDGIKSILVAGLQTLPNAKRASVSNLAGFHMGRIKSLIESNLNDADLSVASIAQQLGLSSGHVHRLFKDEATSLSHYIWNKRLEACSRDLIDPRQAGSSVGEIAYRRGFSDAAHFSRTFRKRFGCSPRDWRCANRPSTGTMGS
jgi:AraC-like DNA-binding protein